MYVKFTIEIYKIKKMEERQEFKDNFIKDFVEKGKRTISNEGFENQIMQKIYTKTTYKKEVASKLKRSMYFFYCGLFLIVIYTFVTILNKFILNDINNFISVLTLFFASIIGIIFVGNYKRLLYYFSI